MQVERRRGVLAAGDGEQRVRLAAMVGLVVEEMRQRRRQRLGDVGRPGDRAVAEGAGEVGLAQAVDIGDDALVLRAARFGKRRQVVEQDLVEPRRLRALAGEAAHPDAVGDQQVVERAVERAEEGAAVGAVVGIGELRRRLVEALVGPAIIGGEHGEMRLHGLTPSTARNRSILLT